MLKYKSCTNDTPKIEQNFFNVENVKLENEMYDKESSQSSSKLTSLNGKFYLTYSVEYYGYVKTDDDKIFYVENYNKSSNAISKDIVELVEKQYVP